MKKGAGSAAGTVKKDGARERTVQKIGGWDGRVRRPAAFFVAAQGEKGTMFGGGCPATEKKLSEEGSRGEKGLAAAGKFRFGSDLHAAEDFSFCGRCARQKTACRGGAQKRDSFRPGASGKCCFATCGGLCLPGSVMDVPLACGGGRPAEAAPNVPFRPGGRRLRAFQGGRFVGPPASASIRRMRRCRSSGGRVQKKAAGMPTA